MNNSSQPAHQQGWVALELVLSLPLIIFILGMVFYAGNIGFIQLHLTSAVHAGARVAAKENCAQAETLVRDSVSHSPKLSVNCTGDQIISVEAEYPVNSSLPGLVPLPVHLVKASAFALKEKP